MCKNTEDDKSITFDDRTLKCGAIMFRTKEITKKPDTSTSIVVNWRNSAKMKSITPEKEKLNFIYKSSTYTDGEEGDKGKILDLHMNIMYHPDAKEPSKIILFIPGGGFHSCDYKLLY